MAFFYIFTVCIKTTWFERDFTFIEFNLFLAAWRNLNTSITLGWLRLFEHPWFRNHFFCSLNRSVFLIFLRILFTLFIRLFLFYLRFILFYLANLNLSIDTLFHLLLITLEIHRSFLAMEIFSFILFDFIHLSLLYKSY